MAQYKKNFYGSTHYGQTNVATGVYETTVISTDETLSGSFTVNLTSLLPDATYTYGDSEIVDVNGTWEYDSATTSTKSNTPSAELEATITGDRFTIYYHKDSNAAPVNVEIITKEIGSEIETVSTYRFETNGLDGPDEFYTIDNLLYAKHRIRIYLDSNNASTAYFFFKKIEARVTTITVESRAAYNDGAWTSYEEVPLTKQDNGADYTLTGQTSGYSGKNKVQLKIILGSSDSNMTPEVLDVESISGNTTNRTADGQWEAVLDMQSIASATSSTFSKVKSIDWVAVEPEDTKLTIRSSSSIDNIDYSPVTAPYKQGVNRVRLEDGVTTGYVTTPLVSPGAGSEFTRIEQWQSWDTGAYLPQDETEASIQMKFLDERNDVLHVISQPQSQTDKSLVSLGNQPYRLRIELNRRFDKSTPVIDHIDVSSKMIYEEKQILEDKNISSVDFNQTGEGVVLDTSLLAFTIPVEVQSPIYHLEDLTERPQDVFLYLESEKEEAKKSHQTIDIANDKVWARVNKDNVVTHRQASGGAVIFPGKDETEMPSSFQPALSKNKSYRYYLESGWPSIKHRVKNGETLDDIATMYGYLESDLVANNSDIVYEADGSLSSDQYIAIPNDTTNSNVSIYWKSEENTTRTNITSISSHNAKLSGDTDLVSDFVVAEVAGEPALKNVNWVSDEKIYEGICNPNDILTNYVRKHITPETGDSIETTYIAINGDTYSSIAKKFGIDAEDLSRKNNASTTDVINAGDEIIIPSRIVLPKIDPAVKVGENPYDIEIVYNSVRKGDKILDESFIQVLSLEVVEEEVVVEKEKVTRQGVVNGKDLLNNAKVIEIIDIWDDLVVAAPSYIQNTHYALVDNYVYWGLTPGGGYEEPELGNDYYVSYKCLKPVKVKVTIGSTYKEESGINRMWRSPEIKEFDGTCGPGNDFKVELPPHEDWARTDNSEVEDIEYLVEDNDLWVKTWIEEEEGKHYLIGSLQDRVPKDNWFPTINTGYYYIGKDEYYLFNQPKSITPSKAEMPLAENVTYGEGKYKTAVYMQKGSANLVRNSGFEVANDKKTVYKNTFGTGDAVAALGITI